jgi:hypothetical protein
MDEPLIVGLLEELAESFGVHISYEAIRLDEELGSRPGGVCLFKGQRRVIINPHASSKEKIRILSEAVRQFDLDQIHIRPVLRELLDGDAFSSQCRSENQIDSFCPGFPGVERGKISALQRNE